MPKIEFTESELFGRRVAIESDALKQLSGRTLNLRRVDARYGLMKNTRYVLVADSAPESPISTFEADDSNESTKRSFSIVTLTILGGFRRLLLFRNPWAMKRLVICTCHSPPFRYVSPCLNAAGADVH